MQLTTPSRIAPSLPTTDYDRSFANTAKTCDFPGCERPTAGHPSFPHGSTRCWTHIPKPSKRPKEFGLDEKPDFAHIDRIIAERDRRKAKEAGVMYVDVGRGKNYP
jgi:hypothetical protein